MILGLSGGIAVGKSTVAAEIARRCADVEVVSVRAVLRDVLELPDADRATLQREGAALDVASRGRWLAAYLSTVDQDQPDRVIVVDSFRTRLQYLAVADSLADVRLVHLRATEATRRSRYEASAGADRLKKDVGWSTAVSHVTERQADELASDATLVVDTDTLSPGDVAERALSGLRIARTEPDVPG